MGDVMIDRRDQEKEELESWEKWPLAALFLANALNVFILYVPQEEMPTAVQWMLPWARVFCGLAAAASLEGTLIAVTMGRRLGRDSKWSWATMFAASAFTAAVAYYVHHDIGLAAALLFMGQAVVLFIYTQHLAQPRNSLQDKKGRAADGATRLGSGETAIVLAQSKSRDSVTATVKMYSCRTCGESGFDSLTAVNTHKKTECPNRVI
jgi:hypothetical protein